MAVTPGALLIDLARRQHGFMICSMIKSLVPCLVALLHAVAALGKTPGPALSPTADSKHWTLQIDVPTNCPTPEVPVANATSLIACAVPCNTTGSTAYYVKKGDDITVSFQARPGVVITGGSQNLGFMNDPVVDMKLMTASPPANPITPVTFTGFEFAPKENYYETFQAGVLAKLAVYAFDASRPSHNRTDGLLGMYKSASCRTSINLHLISPPPNVTVGASQLFTQELEQRQSGKMTGIVVPAVIGGFVAATALGCLALGLAKRGAAVKA